MSAAAVLLARPGSLYNWTMPLGYATISNQTNEASQEVMGTCFKDLSAGESGKMISAFWRGSSVHMARNFQSMFLRSKVLDTLRPEANAPFRDLLAVTSFAGFVSTMAAHPIDVFARTGAFSSPFRGVGCALMAGVPFIGMNMAIYDSLKRERASSEKGLKFSEKMGLALVSGVGAQSAVHPFESLRTQGLKGLVPSAMARRFPVVLVGTVPGSAVTLALNDVLREKLFHVEEKY